MSIKYGPWAGRLEGRRGPDQARHIPGGGEWGTTRESGGDVGEKPPPSAARVRQAPRGTPGPVTRAPTASSLRHWGDALHEDVFLKMIPINVSLYLSGQTVSISLHDIFKDSCARGKQGAGGRPHGEAGVTVKVQTLSAGLVGDAQTTLWPWAATF